MSDKDKGGDKTELPTHKKLQDARKKGDIAKGKEITPTVGTFAILVLFLAASGYVAQRIVAFMELALAKSTDGDFAVTLSSMAGEAVVLMVMLSAIVLTPLAAVAVLAEILQTKGLIAAKKLEPKLENLNPVEGIKRMFGKDGLIELAKTLAKAVAIGVTVWFVTRGHVEQMGAMLVPATNPIWQEGAGMRAGSADAALLFSLTIQVLGWVAAVFVFIALLDYAWSKQRFTKKMMMSRRDIKDEIKRDEGDPHIKGHRKQMAQEWAQSGSVSKAANASAVLVNPTHIAIALDYNPDEAPVPVVAARGDGDIATAMRHAATDAGVPIIRHIPTARALWARGEIGEMVPEDMFDAIAEVILWARKARDGEAPMECDLHAYKPAELAEASA